MIVRAWLYYTNQYYNNVVQWNNNGPISAHTRVAQYAELLIVSWVFVVTREVTAFNTPCASPHEYLSLWKGKHPPSCRVPSFKRWSGGRRGTRPTHFQASRIRCGEQVSAHLHRPLCIGPQCDSWYYEDRRKTNYYPLFTDPFKSRGNGPIRSETSDVIFHSFVFRLKSGQ